MSILNTVNNNPALMMPTEKLGLAVLSASLEKGSTIIELGTHKGASSAILLETGNSPDIYTIDIKNQIDPDILEQSRVLFFEGNSAQFAHEHGNLKADFLFIDGYHTMMSAATDFMNLKPLLRDNGLIAFHDCHYTWPGVLALSRALMSNGNIRDWSFLDSLFVGHIDHSRPFPSAAVLVQKALQVADEILDICTFAASKVQGGLPGYLKLGSKLSPECQPQMSQAAALDIHCYQCRELHSFEKLVEYASDGSGRACFIGTGRQGKNFAMKKGFDPALLMNSSDVENTDAVCLILSAFADDIRNYLIQEKGILEKNILEMDYIRMHFYDHGSIDHLVEEAGAQGYDAGLLENIFLELKKLSQNEIHRLAESGVLNLIFWEHEESDDVL